MTESENFPSEPHQNPIKTPSTTHHEISWLDAVPSEPHQTHVEMWLTSLPIPYSSKPFFRRGVATVLGARPCAGFGVKANTFGAHLELDWSDPGSSAAPCLWRNIGDGTSPPANWVMNGGQREACVLLQRIWFFIKSSN